MDTTNAINICVPFTAAQEGFEPSPYMDAGSPAIGYGNHYYEDGSAVSMDDDPIDQDTALSLLTFYVSQVANQISPMITAPVTDNMLAALTDLAYNWGTGNFGNSKLLQLINSGATKDQITAQWNITAITSQGSPDSTLVNRRSLESQLAFSEGSPGIATAALVLAGIFIILFIVMSTKKSH
jgi:lysozyme